MKLSGSQFEQFEHALLDAFPEESSLKRMLLYRLDKKLNEIAVKDSLDNIVFKLIEKAEAEGWTKDLVQAARLQNPGNLKLKAIAEKLFPNLETSSNSRTKNSHPYSPEVPVKPDYVIFMRALDGYLSESRSQKSEELKETPKAETKPDVVVLPTFKFDVATVQVISPQSPGQKPTINIVKHPREAHYFTENLPDNITLEMVSIPGGKFIMGSPETEEGSREEERPQFQATVQPIFMGKYPVTQAQWRVVAKLPQVNRSLKSDPSYFKGDNLPIESISWYDAVEFCDRISKYTGKKYRLPSEAQWEYACRGGTTTPFHFGETITPKLANYNDNYTYGSGTKGKYRGRTTPVGSFEVANAFGLYDMHGNVCEWCADDWHNNYNGAPTNGNAWVGTVDDDNNRLRNLLRGGSWLLIPDYCRSASRRNDDYYNLGNNFIGFRVALTSVAMTF
jgi:formylglycine-generating enzyme required for sulfatase activity